MEGDDDTGLQDDAELSPLMLSKADLSLVPVSIVVGQVDRQCQVLEDPAHLTNIFPELLADHQLGDEDDDGLDEKKAEKDCEGVAEGDRCVKGVV